VKLPTLVCLASLSLAPNLSAQRYVAASLPTVEDHLQRPELARALERALRETFADDGSIAIFDVQEKGPHFDLELSLKHDVRFPEEEAIFCKFISPSGEERALTLLFSPAQLNQRGTTWLAKTGAETIANQLKAESVVSLKPRLDPDMNKNIVHLDASRRELQVDILGKSSAWRETQNELSQKQLPTALRHQDLDSPELLTFAESPKVKVLNPNNLPEKELPYERLPLKPFKAQVESELQRQLTFPYPRFQTSGPMALLFTPSLSMVECDPRFYATFATEITATNQSFNGVGPTHSFTKLNWDGPLYRQYYSLSTKLWQRLGLSLETGYGQQDAQIELEIDHPTAPGGTTFLPAGGVSGGMLDTTLTINGLWETPSMLFRPHMIIKLPTGDEKNLLGSGHADYSLGASLEGYWQDWHVKSMLSYTRPGELNIFDPGQAPIKTIGYLYAAFGMGRVLNIFGGERVAMSLNAMENPMRRATNLEDLDKVLVSFNALVEKNFTDDFRLRLEAGYGLTTSAADSTLGLSAFLRF
jgi:hypothetical protein